jgi:hypothetical protein
MVLSLFPIMSFQGSWKYVLEQMWYLFSIFYESVWWKICWKMPELPHLTSSHCCLQTYLWDLSLQSQDKGSIFSEAELLPTSLLNSAPPWKKPLTKNYLPLNILHLHSFSFCHIIFWASSFLQLSVYWTLMGSTLSTKISISSVLRGKVERGASTWDVDFYSTPLVNTELSPSVILFFLK